MSPSTPNADRADANKAVAWYIAQRDQTPRAECPDPDITAGEIVQALMLRGWRRTAARAAPAWTPDPTATPADPATVRARAAQARAGLARRTPTLPALTAAQVEDLYNDRITELDYAGHTLTRADIDDAWLTIPIGPDDIDEDGCPADHMWLHLADAMTRWHEPQEGQ